MPEFDVTVTVSESRTYTLTVRAKNEDSAGEKALEQMYQAKESGKPLPWDEADFSEDVEVDDVVEV
jgi:hypothetical protein